MNRIRALALLVIVALAATGCFLARPNMEEQIVGRWKTELAGFPLVVEYTESTLGIGSYPPVAYTLEGDVLSFEFEGTQARRVLFQADGVMVQTDLTTGIERKFTREAN